MAKHSLSRRRQKIKVRHAMAFAVTRNASGEVEALTVFAGRRALTREISPQLAASLVAALIPSHQSPL